MITELNERSREVFRLIMADLEDSGLLFAPHTSAGRLPTDAGLRLFVDGLLEIGNLSAEERESIKGQCAGSSNSLDGLLEEATAALSGLTGCASLVLAPKTESPLKHIEFVNLSPGRSLVVLVTESGIVENRIIQTPEHLPPSSLVKASNFLSAKLVGRTIPEAYDEIMTELDQARIEIDALTSRVVESGLAVWSGDANTEAASAAQSGSLIVRGQAHLLEDVSAMADLERIRALFSALETKEEILKLLSLADTAEGVQIFIGAENELFHNTECSMIVAPYRDSKSRFIGAIGVIGPTRINYARIVPLVDHTASVIGRILS